jgi:hypothetical protein
VAKKRLWLFKARRQKKISRNFFRRLFKAVNALAGFENKARRFFFNGKKFSGDFLAFGVLTIKKFPKKIRQKISQKN